MHIRMHYYFIITIPILIHYYCMFNVLFYFSDFSLRIFAPVIYLTNALYCLITRRKPSRASAAGPRPTEETSLVTDNR